MEASDKDGLTRGYGAVLWQPAEFWTAIWDYFEVLGDWDHDPALMLAGDVVPDVRWFRGATLNYARNALRTAWTDPGRAAIVFDSERSRRGRLTSAELAAEVARVATRAVLSYVKKPLRHNELAESSGAVEPGADRS
jgi:Acetyl-coenzyme A synthetase N-terminus